jgi:hypothetical protein
MGGQGQAEIKLQLLTRAGNNPARRFFISFSEENRRFLQSNRALSMLAERRILRLMRRSAINARSGYGGVAAMSVFP